MKKKFSQAKLEKWLKDHGHKSADVTGKVETVSGAAETLMKLHKVKSRTKD